MEDNLRRLTDEELISEFQSNNTIEAFDILVKRYKDPLTNFVFRYVGDRDVCEDIVQDALIKFYLNKDSYKSFAKFSTWIYTIAINLAKNELKRRKRKNIFSINNDEDYKTDIVDKSNLLPDDHTDAALKSEFIQNALMKLKPVYREIIILRDVQEMQYEEIAEITGLSIGTVKSRINRGRAKLQKYLKTIYND